MRNGIMASGNWIIDHVKVIDTYPTEGMLTNITKEYRGTGGAPYNVLIDLARMKTSVPLYAHGLVGTDADGDFIIRDLAGNGIDNTNMRRVDGATSYTDVMSVVSTGARTFFHCRGVNAQLCPDDFTGLDVPARIFHIGYLLLLDALDAPDAEYGVVAARLLSDMSKRGYKTSVDVVSEQGDRFKRIVLPCLKHTDYLILNEIEAGESTGMVIRRKDGGIDAKALERAAAALLDAGVRELVVIHFPEGGYVKARGGATAFAPSFQVEQSEIKGTAGAGDAFCAGMLYAIHEGLPLTDALSLANASARFNLLSPTCTDGAAALEELERYRKTARLRVSVV
ncbi:MAG: carbohydrate kinase family protein [Spirochaetota bacterium]